MSWPLVSLLVTPGLSRVLQRVWPVVTPGQAGLDTGQQGVHFLGSGGEDGPELVPVDLFGDLAAGVADEPGDLFDSLTSLSEIRLTEVCRSSRGAQSAAPIPPARKLSGTTGGRSPRRGPAGGGAEHQLPLRFGFLVQCPQRGHRDLRQAEGAAGFPGLGVYTGP
jgi:hypothetical protein